MTTVAAVLVAVPALVIVIAWLADAGARRSAWRNIARARRGAHGPEACPHCRTALPAPDGLRDGYRRGDATRPAV